MAQGPDGRARALILALLTMAVFTLATVEGNKEKTSIKMLVPLKLGFQEFVMWRSVGGRNETELTFSGFSIEVFERCVEILKSDHRLNYTFVAYGDGSTDPQYDGLLQELVDSEDIDGVVADITITKDRWEKAEFTQPYVQSSLRMLVPLRSGTAKVGFWIFLAPFSTRLWVVIVSLYVSTALCLFYMELKDRDRHPQSPTCQALFSEMLWYTTMAIFFSQKNDPSSRLGRLLTTTWLIVVLIFQSSYTASLSSILAAQQPIPAIANFVDLQKSRLQIGHQTGTFVLDYMTQNLGIGPQRLVALDSEVKYEHALASGEVSAIVDESPYVDTFLTSYGCQFTALDPSIAYFGGFAFAFKKGSQLTDAFSLAIVTLEQNGGLQSIKDKWLGSGKCASALDANSNISIDHFRGLFSILVVLYVGFFVLRSLRLIRDRIDGKMSRVHAPEEVMNNDENKD